jgi:hypothetical protein
LVIEPGETLVQVKRRALVTDALPGGCSPKGRDRPARCWSWWGTG